jgi:hypothetical protein
MARIEVYLPDVRRPNYRNLLARFRREFTYTFGGVTVKRGLQGWYLSRQGRLVKDRVTVIYTDVGISLDKRFDLLSLYTDEIRQAAMDALAEEAVLIAVVPVFHSTDHPIVV